MAKQSTVQIQANVVGDGVNSQFFADDTNAGAPGAGPFEIVIGAGGLTLAVPAGATGFIVSPGGSSPTADLELGSYTAEGDNPQLGTALDPARVTRVALRSGIAAVFLYSTAGGTALLQWT